MSSAQVDGEQPVKNPAKLGKYTVVREIGKGGMARVFEGWHADLGRRVALKLVQPAFATHPAAAGRFLREAKAASQIRHQNVVEVFDIGTHEGLPFIVMELLEGADFATLLAQRGAIRLGCLSEVFLPITSAVATAHRLGIIHRDLKPANVVLTERPPLGQQPVILDFGISKMLEDDDEHTLTRSESLLGTVAYMAPELTRGAKFASAASDQYALGAMLYECATGRRPFHGESYYDLMHAIVTEPVRPPSDIEASLPPEFDELVLRAMARDPDKRFPSVHALGRALLPFADKTAWAIWQCEFLGEPETARHPWGDRTGTLPDDGTPRPLVVTRRAAEVGPRKRAPWLLPAIAVYAGATTLLLVRARAQPDPPTAPIPITTTPGAPEPAPAQLAISNSVITPPTVESAPAPTAPVVPPDHSTVSRARGPSKAHNVSPAEPALSTAVPTAISGTNGALIFE